MNEAPTRPATARARKRHPWLILSLAILLLAGVLAAMAARHVMALVPTTPDVSNIQQAKTQYPSVLLTADGQELATIRRIYREWVKLADISPAVVDALLSTEDRRFYQHGGLDLKRTAAAALNTLRGDREGGSTLTQQLVRNLFPKAIGREPTIDRKLREAITALKIEEAYTKDEILETYLNTVPFLYNAYGIEMAARTYFGKSAGQLDVREAATLVGMLKGTRSYNPVLNPERSLQRRNLVLAQMVRNQRLDPAQLASLQAQPLGLDFERQQEELGPAPHLVQHLRRWLIEWADRHGHDLHADGLVVRTTIDSRLQAMATEALARQTDKLQAIASKQWKPAEHQALVQAFLRETPQYRAARDRGASDEQALKQLRADAALMQSLWQDKTRLQAGFLALDPGSGRVLAWIGSRDFRQDQFDHVEQARRQPGSTFKPFVYGAAFEQGISPDEPFIDEVLEFQVDDRTVWQPTDIGEPSGQPLSARDGLVFSKNTITAQVMQRVGPARVAQVAQGLGVRHSKLDAVPSLALGTSPVTLKEMVSAYGSIVNDGRYVEPVLVTRIERRDGTVVADFQPGPPEQGLSPKATQILLDVMRGAVDRGTGAAIRSRYGIRGDVAGKTGTTQDYTDGWFILMHPQLVGGAWVGFNDNRVTMRNDRWGQGSRNALHIVGDFFQQVQKAKLIDTKARFAAPRLKPVPIEPLPVPGYEWLGGMEPNRLPPDQQPSRPAIVAQPEPPEFQWSPEPPRHAEAPGESRRAAAVVIRSYDGPMHGHGRPPPVIEYAPAPSHDPSRDGRMAVGGGSADRARVIN
jgi:penicillin-binding protein 1A